MKLELMQATSTRSKVPASAVDRLRPPDQSSSTVDDRDPLYAEPMLPARNPECGAGLLDSAPRSPRLRGARTWSRRGLLQVALQGVGALIDERLQARSGL